jgi:hypothetical protein
VLELTVVIPARSAPDPIRRMLAASPHDVAMVVVDDGSPTPLPVALQPQPNPTILRHEFSQGPPAARNAGAGAAATTTPSTPSCAPSVTSQDDHDHK